MENNLSETAFFVPEDAAYQLRWFTPACEVDLCGHATVASAYVIMEHLRPGLERVVFRSRSGELPVTREDGRYALDFPSRKPSRIESPAALRAALGADAVEVWKARDLMVVLDSERAVRELKPDLHQIAQLDAFAVIVTARGESVDFVSRFFAPARGVPEDPVTGSAHCTLIPYWSERLGKARLRARQVSARGGELFCEDRGDRVTIAGGAVLFAHGTIFL